MTPTELLLRCLRRDATSDVGPLLEAMDEAGWTRLIDAAIWHGVAPLLHVRLRSLPALAGSPLAARLRDVHLHCLLHNVAIRGELEELVREADALGCGILFLKGAYLAHCVYEEPGARSMNDIDVLVGADYIVALRDHLLASGYADTKPSEPVDYYHLAPIARSGSFEVELHRDLAPAHAPFQLDVDGLWARASSTDLGDFVLPHPAPDDVLLHVCVHTAFNHEFKEGLRGACDVDTIVTALGARIEWGRLVATANADARSRYVYAALGLTQALLGTPIPGAVMESLHREPEDEHIVSEVQAFVLSTADPVPVTLRAMRDAEGVTAKLRALWRGVFPPADVLRRVYSMDPGSPRVALLYAARPFDLFMRRGKRVLDLVGGSRDGAPIREKDALKRRISAWARDER